MFKSKWLWFGGYAATSYYFLQHPEVLHFKKINQITAQNSSPRKVIIAHRGGSIENPENTLQAFKHVSDSSKQ